MGPTFVQRRLAPIAPLREHSVLNPAGRHGIVLVLALAVAGSLVTGRPSLPRIASKPAIGPPTNRASAAVTKQKYGELPLSFVPNAGQADPAVRYSAQAPGFAVSFAATEALFSFLRGKQGAMVGLRFLAANPNVPLTATDPLPGRVNYLIGDRALWHTNLPT